MIPLNSLPLQPQTPPDFLSSAQGIEVVDDSASIEPIEISEPVKKAPPVYEIDIIVDLLLKLSIQAYEVEYTVIELIQNRIKRVLAYSDDQIGFYYSCNQVGKIFFSSYEEYGFLESGNPVCWNKSSTGEIRERVLGKNNWLSDFHYQGLGVEDINKMRQTLTELLRRPKLIIYVNEQIKDFIHMDDQPLKMKKSEKCFLNKQSLVDAFHLAELYLEEHAKHLLNYRQADLNRNSNNSLKKYQEYDAELRKYLRCLKKERFDLFIKIFNRISLTGDLEDSYFKFTKFCELKIAKYCQKVKELGECGDTDKKFKMRHLMRKHEILSQLRHGFFNSCYQFMQFSQNMHCLALYCGYATLDELKSIAEDVGAVGREEAYFLVCDTIKNKLEHTKEFVYCNDEVKEKVPHMEKLYKGFGNNYHILFTIIAGLAWPGIDALMRQLKVAYFEKYNKIESSGSLPKWLGVEELPKEVKVKKKKKKDGVKHTVETDENGDLDHSKSEDVKEAKEPEKAEAPAKTPLIDKVTTKTFQAKEIISLYGTRLEKNTQFTEQYFDNSAFHLVLTKTLMKYHLPGVTTNFGLNVLCHTVTHLLLEQCLNGLVSTDENEMAMPDAAKPLHNLRSIGKYAKIVFPKGFKNFIDQQGYASVQTRYPYSSGGGYLTKKLQSAHKLYVEKTQTITDKPFEVQSKTMQYTQVFVENKLRVAISVMHKLLGIDKQEMNNFEALASLLRQTRSDAPHMKNANYALCVIHALYDQMICSPHELKALSAYGIVLFLHPCVENLLLACSKRVEDVSSRDNIQHDFIRLFEHYYTKDFLNPEQRNFVMKYRQGITQTRYPFFTRCEGYDKDYDIFLKKVSNTLYHYQDSAEVVSTGIKVDRKEIAAYEELSWVFSQTLSLQDYLTSYILREFG